jgi:hypothetical protein
MAADLPLNIAAGLAPYSDAGCTTPAGALPITAGHHSVDVYLQVPSLEQNFLLQVSVPSIPSISAQNHVLSSQLAFSTLETHAGIAKRGLLDGVGSAARLSSPDHMVTGGSSLYFVDYGGSMIRKFDPVTQAVTTIAGGPTVGSSIVQVDGPGANMPLSEITAMAYSHNKLYFAESSCLRVMDLATNLIQTLVGNCLSNGATDGIGTEARLPTSIVSIQIDSTGSKLYLSNFSGIWKIDLSTLQSTLMIGDASTTGDTNGTGTAARINLQQGSLLLEDDNTLIIGEFLQIKSVNLSSLIVSLLHTGISAQGNLVKDGAFHWAYNTGQADYLIKVNPADFSFSQYGSMSYGSFDGTANGGSFRGITSLAVLNGIVYATEGQNGVIRKLDLAGNTMTTVAGQGDIDFIQSPTASELRMRSSIILGASSTDIFYAEKFGSCSIVKVNIATGASTPFAGSMTRGWNSGDSCKTLDGTATNARFGYQLSPGVVVSGFLYFGDGNAIRKVDISNGNTITLPINTQNANGPIGMAAISTKIFFGDGNAVKYFDVTNPAGTLSLIAGNYSTAGNIDGNALAARFNTVMGVAATSGNTLFVADRYSIRSFNLGPNTVTTIAGGANPGYYNSNALNAQFSGITGITLSPDEKSILIQDSSTLRMYNTTTTIVTTVLGNSGLAEDQDGSLEHARVAQYAVMSGIIWDSTGAYFSEGSSGIRKLH